MSAINKPIEIFRGDDPTIQIEFVTEDDKNVLKTEDVSADVITFKFPGESGDVSIVGTFVTNGSDGLVKVAFTDVQTNALKTGEKQTFYAVLDNAGVERTVKFRSLLTVDDRDFRD